MCKAVAVGSILSSAACSPTPPLPRARRKLPEPPDFKLLAGAGHFVFMAPCDSDQLATMPGICTDADGVDREGIHRDMVSEAGRFFSRTLGEATRAGLQTADQ